MKYKLIAHRLGFKMGEYEENSKKALEDIFDNYDKLNICDGFEFDIRFTKDSIPILFHDKNTRDFSEELRNIKNMNLIELKKLKLNYRNQERENVEKICTLEDILDFFHVNEHKLNNKIIKIETKNKYLSKKEVSILCKILNKHKNIQKNIINLSFYPNNLVKINKFQGKNNLYINKTDLLCDYKFVYYATKFIKCIDTVSLRFTDNNKLGIKYYISSKFKNKKVSFKKIIRIKLNKKLILNVNKKYDEVNIYTINSKEDCIKLLKLCNNLNLYVTTDNPLELRNDI